MISQTFEVAGETVAISTLQSPGDLDDLRDFFRRNGDRRLALDTETTGLNTWAPDFRVRLVQIGTAHEAFVIPVEDAWSREAVQAILRHQLYDWVLHNASYDLMATRATGLLQPRVEDFALRVHDTRHMSHLVDPRGQMDGGVGHSLKAQTGARVDPSAPDTGKDLHKHFKSYRVPVPGQTYASGKRKGEQKYRPATVAEGWSLIDTFDPLYTLYAGLDVIFTSRLYESLRADIVRFGMDDLWQFERHVARVCLIMQANGMRVDTSYARWLSDHLRRDAESYQEKATELGCSNVNAPARVVEALQARGVALTKTTKSGNPSADASVLEALAKEGDDLSRAIIASKRSDKWRTAYVDQMINLKDGTDRVHPVINSLQAVTRRMSVSDPPFQQLPSKKSSGLNMEEQEEVQ